MVFGDGLQIAQGEIEIGIWQRLETTYKRKGCISRGGRSRQMQISSIIVFCFSKLPLPTSNFVRSIAIIAETCIFIYKKRK